MGTAVAGLNTRIEVSGTSVAVVDEACTENSPTEFQITDADRRVLDERVAIVVEVDATPQDPSTFAINWLFGKITFDSSQTGTTVTFTGNYEPRTEVAQARTADWSMEYDEDEDTKFGESGESNVQTVQRVTAQIDMVDVAETILTGSTTIGSIFDAAERILVQFAPRGVGEKVYRAWVHVRTLGIESDATGLVTASMELRGANGQNQGRVLLRLDTI